MILQRGDDYNIVQCILVLLQYCLYIFFGATLFPDVSSTVVSDTYFTTLLPCDLSWQMSDVPFILTSQAKS